LLLIAELPARENIPIALAVFVVGGHRSEPNETGEVDYPRTTSRSLAGRDSVFHSSGSFHCDLFSTCNAL